MARTPRGGIADTSGSEANSSNEGGKQVKVIGTRQGDSRVMFHDPSGARS